MSSANGVAGAVDRAGAGVLTAVAEAAEAADAAREDDRDAVGGGG